MAEDKVVVMVDFGIVVPKAGDVPRVSTLPDTWYLPGADENETTRRLRQVLEDAGFKPYHGGLMGEIR